LGDLVRLGPQMLDGDQEALLDQATALRDGLTHQAETIEDAKEIASKGIARMAWGACGDDGEERLASAGVSVRCLLRDDGQPVDDPSADGVDALLARAY